MTDTVIFERKGHVGHLLLNRKDRHNALGKVQLLAIRQYLEEAAADEQLRVLLISAVEGCQTFCAGAALDEMSSGEIDGNFFQDTTDAIGSLEIPTICAINGNVYGGGVELALSCDFRIGCESITMKVPAAQFGLCYPVNGIRRFQSTLGISVAKRLLVAGEQMNAEEMYRVGILDHLYLDAQLTEEANRYAERIAGLGPLAVKAMKNIIDRSASGSMDVDNAEALAMKCRNSADLQEGLAAQREKRKPRFSGC